MYVKLVISFIKYMCLMPKKIKKQLVVRTRNAWTWTEAEFWSKIRSSLRKLSMFWKPITNYKKSKQKPYKWPKKNQKYVYECERCKGIYASAEVEINHIVPAWSLKSSDDLKWFVDRLFTETWFECLCKNCHLVETKKQKDDKKNQW